MQPRNFPIVYIPYDTYLLWHDYLRIRGPYKGPLDCMLGESYYIFKYMFQAALT